MAGGGSSGQSGGTKSKQGTSSQTGFFNKTQDKSSSKSQSDGTFTQKMLQYGKDVQSKRDQQKKEQEIIEKKMAKRGGKKNTKTDVPNGNSKTKMLTSFVSKK